MKPYLLLLAVVAFATSASAQAPDRAITDPLSVSAAAKPAVSPPPIRALFDAHASLGAAWGADGHTVIVSTNQGGRFNLWRFPVDGGGAHQISHSDDRQWGQVVSPDGKVAVFQSDHAGGEHYDLFAVPTAGGDAVNLTNTPDVSETDAQFSPEGKALAFSHKLASQPGANVALMDFASHAVRLLTHEADPKMTWHVVAWTDGGKALIANRANFLGTKGGVWKIDAASGVATPLTPEAGESLTEASDVSPDGRYLAVASNARSEQLQAALFDIAAGQFIWVAKAPWDQATASFSPDGHDLLFQTNADGRTEMALYDLASRTVLPLDLPPGVNGASGAGHSDFSPDSRLVLVSHAASNTPFDYWLYDTVSGKGRPLTHFAPSSFNPAEMPASNLVHYKSADGTVISAFLWLPNGLKRDGSAPGIVLPHGGPTGQTTDTFNRTAIALASRGYVVIAPNVRGSTGYGKAFQLMNIKDLGGADLVDEVYATKFMVATGYVNPKKIGITGGSYGGYMTLMAIGKTPDIWAAAVEEYGIIDWLTMLKHEDPELQAYEKSLLGDPETDPKVYTDDSPITYIRQAKAPLLVLQGDNDIRVPKEEAEQVVSILKSQGRIVDAHFYPGEGHGFVKLENGIDSYERMIAWFETYMPPAR